MEADLNVLKDRVLKTTRDSALGREVEDVVLEADRDEDGTGFLRVVIQMKSSSKTDDASLETLLEAIERSVSELDERYASVRFAEAA